MGAVMDLTIDAMRSKEEAKLKSILAALWHLSSNSDDNKAEICAVEGALPFLVDMLDYEAPSKSVTVAENASGVLKNVSSHVATRDEYKVILREKQCMPVLLRHLKSPSTVLVNNVCGTLCNLSKHCPKDQQILWDAILDTQSIPLIQNLVQSKHKAISTNASVLLRNLLSAKCHNSNLNVGLAHKDVNVNVNVRGCADKENARVIKNGFNKEIGYCGTQSFVSISSRMVDNYKILNNRTEVRYIQSVTEKSEQRKAKFCPKPNLRDENYDPCKSKDMIRTSVPLNSPSDHDNFSRIRACSSPVDENSPLNELLDNNGDGTSNCLINEISPPYSKQRFQNYIPNGSSHHTSPIYNISAEKNSSSFDEDVNDQPVDYSKKYVERNAVALPSTMIDNVRPERPPKKEYSVHRSKVNLFGDYAETDIDQPTNYSLRYAEDDTDEDEKPTREYFPGGEQEDTVQTYCTEGTPYQTPFAFSTSTSMSDLREDKDGKGAKTAKEAKPKERQVAPLNLKLPESCDERPPSTPKEAKDLSDLNIMSPEKPVNYCEEGTPGYFSRVSSLSSLNSGMAGLSMTGPETPADKTSEVLDISCEGEKIVEDKREEKFETSSDRVDGPKVVPAVDKDVAKTVSFGTDNLCNETPLMFSRCSSLSSLSGFEQHSIPEDRSSTYDLSRRTSGLISPSEIPDSPTQTVPPSPKHHKSPCGEFGRKMQEDKSSARNSLSMKPLVAMRSIFEDEMATYKEESTPIEFSAATSLSSLTIDDDVPRILNESKEEAEELEEDKADAGEEGAEEEEEGLVVRGERSEQDDQPQTAEGRNSENPHETASSENEREPSDADEDDDEDILAACINMGMRNNRYRQSSSSSKKCHQPKLPALPNFPRYAACPALDCIEPPLLKSPPAAPKAKSNLVEVPISPDTMHVYCTEDTPADISPVGSHSNLSALSLASIPDYDEDFIAASVLPHKTIEDPERKGDLSDESSNLSGDEEKLLDKCIQSGMPKERAIAATSGRPATAAIPVVNSNKSGGNKFTRCETPSTSPVEPVPEPTTSSAQCPQYTTPVPEIDPETFDDSSNHSEEDEAILAECIKSAMPKERATVPRLSPAMPKRLPVAPPRSNLCTCPTVSPLRPNYLENADPHLGNKCRLEPSEDSLSLSEEEEDMMLAQCIKSGMPKAPKAGSRKAIMRSWKKS